MRNGSLPERIGLPHSIQGNEPSRMYHTTGFSKDEIVDLCVMIHAAESEPGINGWPPILGLFKSVTVALTYMRRNRVQEELAETYSVSGSWKLTGIVLPSGYRPRPLPGYVS